MADNTKIPAIVTREQPKADVIETIQNNHKTEHALEAKRTAKAHGAAGRFRGKAKAKQNNKARGGKRAR